MTAFYNKTLGNHLSESLEIEKNVAVTFEHVVKGNNPLQVFLHQQCLILQTI